MKIGKPDGQYCGFETTNEGIERMYDRTMCCDIVKRVIYFDSSEAAISDEKRRMSSIDSKHLMQFRGKN